MAVFIYYFFKALHIVSLNVCGLRDADKRAGVLQWLRCLPFLPDVVCLQEVHCISDREISALVQLFWF